MASLSYPNHPSHLSFLTPHEPMRMTLSDDPVVAMMVQKNAKAGQRGDGTGLFLVIKKDGSMVSLSCTEAYGQGLRFIDYLQDGESFTIHGDAPDRPEEPIDGTYFVERPERSSGCFAKSIPPFIPYMMDIDGNRYRAINVPMANAPRTLTGLIFDERTETHWTAGLSNSCLFVEYLEDRSIERWRTHKHAIAPRLTPDQWPT